MDDEESMRLSSSCTRGLLTDLARARSLDLTANEIAEIIVPLISTYRVHFPRTSPCERFNFHHLSRVKKVCS